MRSLRKYSSKEVRQLSIQAYPTTRWRNSGGQKIAWEKGKGLLLQYNKMHDPRSSAAYKSFIVAPTSWRRSSRPVYSRTHNVKEYVPRRFLHENCSLDGKSRPVQTILKTIVEFGQALTRCVNCVTSYAPGKCLKTQEILDVVRLNIQLTTENARPSWIARKVSGTNRLSSIRSWPTTTSRTSRTSTTSRTTRGNAYKWLNLWGQSGGQKQLSRHCLRLCPGSSVTDLVGGYYFHLITYN